MKKGLLSFTVLIFLVLCLTSIKIVFSQDSGTKFNQAHREYSLSAEDYRASHDEYVLARSQYLKFKTLTAENNAKEATIRMLETRDEVAEKYLSVLKMRIEEIEGVPDATREALFLRIDEERTWFSEHKERLPSAGSLEDLVSDSDEAKGRFEAADPLIYEGLSVISSGRVNNFRARLKNIFSSVRDKINKIKEEERSEYKFSTRKIQIIERWIFETEGRISRSEEKQVEADSLISEISGKSGGRGKSSVGTYSQVLSKLGESQQYLKEASLYVIEIIREIKTAE